VETEYIKLWGCIDNEYIWGRIFWIERKAFDYLQIQFVFEPLGFAHENGEPVGISEGRPVHGEADIGES
jgi:hypothetical protein